MTMNLITLPNWLTNHSYCFVTADYLDRLKLPKYIIAAGNDEFFMPDDTYYFYDKLIGPSYYR